MKSEPPISMRDRLREDYRWTSRQREVLSLLAAGKSNGEIAEILGISLPGAKWHVREILSKLNASSREEAAEYWRHHNGLAPRFGRIFRGLARVSLPKLAAAGGLTGVIAVSVAVVLSQSGSDGGGMFARR